MGRQTGIFLKMQIPNYRVLHCLVCGRKFDKNDWFSGGHVYHEDIGLIIFGACSDHYEIAKSKLTEIEEHRVQGYIGEWTEEMGVMIETECECYQLIKLEKSGETVLC